ncbi:MAG: sulfotransferase [Solirubrobacteraceae bacterium]|nr:sulfotransferase [Solirubrobacteraceae bacterium]
MTWTAPRHAYFVCATPRSGSTLVCEALARTGVAGRPAEYFEALRATDVPRRPHEYFDLPDAELEALLPRVEREPDPALAGARSYLDYLAWTRDRGTTHNGVFGAKLMFGYLGEFAGRLRETGAFAGETDLDVLESAFPGARYVRVVRLDKVSQAVSLWTAIQTQAWRHGAPEAGAEPVYHRRAIAHLVRYLTEHEDHWSTLFARARVRPLTITYEDLVAAWEPTMRRVLAHLRLPGADGVEPPDPPLRRQADERSRAWVERFRAEGRPAQARR